MELSRHKRRILLIQAIFLYEDKLEKDSELSSDKERQEYFLKYIWDEFSKTPYAEDLAEFDTDRYYGMIEKLEELRKALVEYAPEWPLDKIASHDRAVLYLGMYELLHTDVPPAVIINECVELSKEFGGTRSSQFINGVLSSVNKEKEKEGKKKDKK